MKSIVITHLMTLVSVHRSIKELSFFDLRSLLPRNSEEEEED